MKVGLVLSGGVVRGAAHVGVLEVLLNAKIPIDFVAGASAGSIVAGLHAIGKTPNQMRDYMMGIGWSKIARPTLSTRGLISFALMEQSLDKFACNKQIEDFAIPCAIVATDLNQSQPCVFSNVAEGLNQNGRSFISKASLGRAVRASSSVPGAVVPLEIDGRLLADGGLSNNCPIDLVKEMGADYIIAVDLFAPEKPRWGSFGIVRSSLLTMVRTSGGGVYRSDCLIIPELAGTSFIRFSDADKFYELGKKAALAKIEQIKRDIFTS